MAKLLLSCDDYVYCHEGKYYAASQEKADFYLRYLRVFDKLRLVTRCVDEKELKKSRIPLDDRIEYVNIPLFQGPKQYAIKYFYVGRLLSDVVYGCDAAILRLPSTLAMRIYEKVRCSSIPYATEIVFDAYDGFITSKSLLHKLLWKIIDKKMRQICYKANGVSCVTEHYLQRRYFTKLKDGFSSNYSSLALPKSFYGSNKSFPKNKTIIISHVANQVEYNGRKGHKELIEAAAILKQQNINVEVRFAGKDYFGGQEKLTEFVRKKEVADRVKFLGYVDRKTLEEILSTSDLFVLPTRAEGLPRVIIEAMAKGLPCISTNVSGNPELLDSHWLISYDDVLTLAERIKELCTNVELYNEVSITNFKKSCDYEASILEKRRDKFYKKLRDLVK